mgnify:FL=1
MRFNVAQLLKEGVGARRHYTLDEAFEALPETGTTKVRGNVMLTRIDRGIWVSGSLAANAYSMCARCLNITECSVDFPMDEEYISTIEINSGNQISVQKNPSANIKEEEFLLDSRHTLDLTEAVRQYVIINLPMKPLCDQNCSGLCSTCGANLNQHICDCSGQIDFRWGPLTNLLTSN